MREFRKTVEMQKYVCRMKNHGKTIGFVPTMGALHQGHLSLVEAAGRQADIVVVSIFVNPLQFGPKEDLKRYPRDLKRDKKTLEPLRVDALFTPDPAEIYPPGFKTFVEVEELSKKLCGRHRPGHFRGVTTVVSKLFNIVFPDLVFLGEKDFQQLVIIRRLVRDLSWPIQIISCPTVREYDGLALSSRNAYLNKQEREAATILYKALTFARKEIVENKEKDLNRVLFRTRALIGTEPKVRLEYLSAVDPETLEEVRQIKQRFLLALAAHVGQTRLIDNIMI